MIYLANPCDTTVVAHMRAGGRIGLIDTPRQRNVTLNAVVHDQAGVWCADNGCYSNAWDQDQWWSFLTDTEQIAHQSTCLFAVAPDIVGDAWRSHMRSYPWLSEIRKLGYPVAYVVQNNAEKHPIPWHDFDALFIGGCGECPEHGPQPKPIRVGIGVNQRALCPVCGAETADRWKTGPHARTIVAEARRRGKWVHMGRVNTQRRYQYAHAIGCDSVDGTLLKHGARANLPILLSWINHLDQHSLLDHNLQASP